MRVSHNVSAVSTIPILWSTAGLAPVLAQWCPSYLPHPDVLGVQEQISWAPWSCSRPPPRRPGPDRPPSRRRPGRPMATGRRSPAESTRPGGGAWWWPSSRCQRSARIGRRRSAPRRVCQRPPHHRSGVGDSPAAAHRHAQAAGRGTIRAAGQGCTMGRQARAVHGSRSVSTFASVALVPVPRRSATPNAVIVPIGGRP
jgi:hypothetical protein